MIANVPIPMPDQCLDSLAASAWKDNGSGFTVRKQILRILDREPEIDSALCGGITGAFAALDGIGYSDAFELLEAHSYLPLFRPFSSPEAYRSACEHLVSGNESAICRVLAAFDTARIRATRWYCPQCVLEDLDRAGYGYARRTHQVVGVDFCSNHRTPLIRPRLERRAALPGYGVLLSAEELLEPAERASGFELPTDVQLRFAKFVSAALSGSITVLGPNQRRALIADRIGTIERRPNEPRSLPHRFEAIVESAARQGWFESLGFHTKIGTAAHWPALFIAGIAFQEDPIVGLLCAAVLFKDADEYNSCAVRYLDLAPGYLAVGRDKFPIRSKPGFRLTVSLLRALMKRTKDDVVRDFGIGRQLVDQLIDHYPTLSERRERVLFRTALARYKRILAQYAREQGPNATRRGALRFDRAAYTWVIAHDSEYFDQIIPRTSGRRPRGPTGSVSVRRRALRRSRGS